MKKTIIGIIIGIIATILIGSVAIFIYTRFFMFVPDKDGMLNENINANEEEVKFKDITAKEWAEKIAKYEICDVQMVNCYYEDSKFIGVVNNENNETIAHYEFEDETGYALEIFTGHRVDLVNGNVVERNLLGGTQVEFEDEQILAIGYAPDIKLNEFIENNFITNVIFEKLPTLDYRKEASRKNGNGNRLVILPKTSNVEIEIYDCYITESGKPEILDQWGETLNEGFVLLQEYMAESTRPELCIKVKYHGVEDIIPIVFSGKDGKLDLTGHEKLVKDISIY